jgi:hypothetical protein
MSTQLPPRVASALRLADIPPAKLGPARRARLTESERELYFWILRRFATTGRPGRSELGEAAAERGLDIDALLTVFASEDLVHTGRDGEIAVAYPFSGRPTAHRVRFRSGNEVDAMCAIDALGIAPMFDESIEIASQDPIGGEPIRIRAEPDGATGWQPPSAVVVAGVSGRDGTACAGCCQVLNFFVSTENAERWLAEHPDVVGEVISVAEAAAAGRAVFGDVLEGG